MDLETNQLIFSIDRKQYPQLGYYYDLSDEESDEDTDSLKAQAVEDNTAADQDALVPARKESKPPNFSIKTFAVNKHLIAVGSHNNFFIDLWDAERGWFVGGIDTPHLVDHLEWSDNMLVGTTSWGEVLAWCYNAQASTSKKRKFDQVESSDESLQANKKKK